MILKELIQEWSIVDKAKNALGYHASLKGDDAAKKLKSLASSTKISDNVYLHVSNETKAAVIRAVKKQLKAGHGLSNDNSRISIDQEQFDPIIEATEKFLSDNFGKKIEVLNVFTSKAGIIKIGGFPLTVEGWSNRLGLFIELTEDALKNIKVHQGKKNEIVISF